MPRKLYLETRLYNVNDRLASLELCETIDRWIDQNELVDMEHCFLPYRDSNNELEEVEEDEGKAIFNLDIKALRSSAGVVGYFDGIHYDSGCAFEVGCGYAWGYPIHLISTDFFRWTVGDSEKTYVVSKLLEHIAILTYVPDENASITDYRQRQEDIRNRTKADLKEKLKHSFGKTTSAPAVIKALDVKYDYYLDPNFKYTESGRLLLAEVISAIESAGKSYIVGDNQGDISKDIDCLRASGHGIFFDDYFESNVDSGLLHGIAYGIGRPPIVYTSNEQRRESGGQLSWLNVMIYYSAETVVTNLEELKAVITQS